MKVIFLGDSITEGIGASSPETKYVSVAEKLLGCEIRNYGISGTRIARQRIAKDTRTHDWDYVARAEIMDKDADMVFVFGGTNDCGHGNATLGALDSYDVYTFSGAMNLLTDSLLKTYGREKLCFLLPLRRFDERHPDTDITLLDYVNIMKSILDKKEIPYIDLYENGMPRPVSYESDKYFADGLHPNDFGHNWLGERVASYVREHVKK